MPAFKPLKRQKTITGATPSARLRGGAEVERAAEQFAGAIGGVADAVLRQREKQKLQDRNNKAIQIGTSYDDAQRAFFSGELQKTGSDSYENLIRAEEFRENAATDFTKDIEDPDLKRNIEQHILSRSGNMMDSLSRHQAKQRNEVSDQTRETTINGILKDAFGGLEPVNESIERWNRTITSQHVTGQLGEEEASDLIVKGSQQIAEAGLDGVINQDPERAIELIESGAYDELLPQKKIKEFDKEAKALQKAIDKDKETKIKERKKAENDALKEEQRSIGDQFVGELSGGVLTNEQVLKSVLDPTGENSKEHWLKEIEKRDKKVEKDIDKEWKTKPVVEADFIQRIIEDPESVKDSEITDMLGKGLDNETAKQLLTLKQKRIKGDVDPVKEQEEKSAIKRLSDAKTSKFFDPKNKVNNSKLWAENVNNLQRYIQNHPEQDLGLYVDQILAPIEESFIQNLFDIVSFGQPGKEEAIKERQEVLRIEAEAGKEKTIVERRKTKDGRVLVKFSDGTIEAE